MIGGPCSAHFLKSVAAMNRRRNVEKSLCFGLSFETSVYKRLDFNDLYAGMAGKSSDQGKVAGTAWELHGEGITEAI